MFRFAAPEWLPALLLVPLLAAGLWVAGRARARALARFGDAPLVERLTATVSRGGRRARSMLSVVAVGLIVIALARPQFGTRVETVRRVGQDIVVAVDLSRSMLAEDIAPSRLERARLSILRLLSRLDGDRVGLVAFAGDAFIQSPLTVDYSAAALFLNAMDPEIVPVQGTDLGAALRVSLDALDQGARESRTILVVTDGEDHEGTLDPEIRRALESGVIVHTVGVGSPDGVPIPVVDDAGRPRGFLRDEEGAVVTSRLDESTLQDLAERTGGRYVRAGSGGTAFDDLVDDLARADGEAFDAREVTQFEEQYQIFLGLAFLLLLIEIAVPDRKRGRESWAGRFA